MLPRTYQARAIYTGFSPDSSHIAFLKELISIAGTLNPIPMINILIPSIDVEEARKVFTPYFDKSNYHFVNFIPTASGETIWAQDYFELIFNTDTGKTKILDLPYWNREGETIPSALSLFCKKEMISQATGYEKDLPPDDGDYGGNIEPLSEKILAIGSNMLPKTIEKIKANSDQRIIKLNVDWLEAGHVDEVISMLPHKGNAKPCEQTILYSSPRKAFEILKRTPKSEIYSPPIQVHGDEDSLLWPDYFDCIIDQHNKTKKCISFYQANKTYDKIQEKNLEKIQLAFKKHHNCKLPAVASPVIFSPIKSYTEYGYPDDRAIAFNQNIVNNILFYPYIFLPRQSIPTFQDYLEKELLKYKYKIRYTRGDYFHVLMGGIHCATNISYGCDPR